MPCLPATTSGQQMKYLIDKWNGDRKKKKKKNGTREDLMDVDPTADRSEALFCGRVWHFKLFLSPIYLLI